MDHPIRIPQSTKKDLARALNASIARVDFWNFGNEPNYTPAFVQQLRGFEFEDASLKVSIDGAVVKSVGPGTPEKWSGADFSIVVTISRAEETVKKATLVQSKLGRIEETRIYNKPEYARCEKQILKMKHLTRHPKVLEIAKRPGELPTIVSASGILVGRRLIHLTFGDWIAKRVLPTFDGDTRPHFVEDVLDANLTNLRVKTILK